MALIGDPHTDAGLKPSLFFQALYRHQQGLTGEEIVRALASFRGEIDVKYDGMVMGPTLFDLDFYDCFITFYTGSSGHYRASLDVLLLDDPFPVMDCFHALRKGASADVPRIHVKKLALFEEFADGTIYYWQKGSLFPRDAYHKRLYGNSILGFLTGKIRMLYPPY
ncbi:hypothetical protein DB346_23575 [Verrucomicrobia bacterium LW23]|nr:hypothetical protein DB346_23575 [Verrucomicrobia bacterium LW23]